MHFTERDQHLILHLRGEKIQKLLKNMKATSITRTQPKDRITNDLYNGKP